jgi:alpha-glucoside transport system substrate-binding protein
MNSLKKVVSLVLLAAFLLTACAQPAATATTAPQNTQPPAATATTAPAGPEVDFAVMPGGALERAIQGEFTGTTVTVDGAFEGNDVDGVKFQESMKAFQEATGITVN